MGLRNPHTEATLTHGLDEMRRLVAPVLQRKLGLSAVARSVWVLLRGRHRAREVVHRGLAHLRPALPRELEDGQLDHRIRVVALRRVLQLGARFGIPPEIA